MPKVSMLPTLLRESFGREPIIREPEPNLVMDNEEQVKAFAEAGRIDGIMSASYLFNSVRISQVIQGCKDVIDLGCGPATQLAQIAQLNPKINFTGIDLSLEMLGNAQEYCNSLNLKNIKFMEDDISTLKKIHDQSVDGVISTLALHHLPTMDLLRCCFTQVKRVSRPNGALCLIDLTRLKSLKSVIYFAYMNRKAQPHIFSLDYERSLRAAFSVDEYRQLISIINLPNVDVVSTFQIPILIIIKTNDKPIPECLQTKIQDLYDNFPRRYKRELDDIRLFFALGGLKNDRFKRKFLAKKPIR